MKNKNSKLAIGIAIIFEIILVTTIIFWGVYRQWEKLYLYFIAIVCITIPFIITRIANKKKIVLPSSFQPAVLIFILLAQYFGEIMEVYTTVSWWDLFLHGIFGCYGVIIGVHLTQGIVTKQKETTEKRFIIFTLVFAFCFAITLGTIWELFEFAGDYFFKTDMVNGGLEDTMTDLLIKSLGAFITSLFYYHYKAKKLK